MHTTENYEMVRCITWVRPAGRVAVTRRWRARWFGAGMEIIYCTNHVFSQLLVWVTTDDQKITVHNVKYVHVCVLCL